MSNPEVFVPSTRIVGRKVADRSAVLSGGLSQKVDVPPFSFWDDGLFVGEKVVEAHIDRNSRGKGR